MILILNLMNFGSIFGFLVFISIWVFIAYITMKIAEDKGRNKKIAFILGLIFSLIGFLIYWAILDKKK